MSLRGIVFSAISNVLHHLLYSWHLKLSGREIRIERSVGTTEHHYSRKKRKYYFSMLKAFVDPHSSEYEESDSNGKVNRSIYPEADTCDMMNHASIWPYD